MATKLDPSTGKSNLKSDIQRTILAGMASVMAGICTHPIDTCKIRMQIQTPLKDGSNKYKNLVHGLKVIVQEEGFRNGIYKGIEASCAREASYSSLRLGLYEPIKRYINAGPDAPAWKKFAAGGLSGAIGSALANPADLLKTRMQGQPPELSLPLSWYIKDVYNNSGLSGFYVGVVPTLIRATLLNGTKLGT